jgi:hypothetical protein
VATSRNDRRSATFTAVERQRLAALVLVAAVLLIGAWPLLPRDRDAESTAEPVRASAPSPKEVSAEPPVRVADTARQVIPRPQRAKRTAPSGSSTPDAAKVDTGIEKGGVDRSLQLDAKTLAAVADRMRPSIAACVDAWTTQVPEIAGRVVLGFDLGPDGVESAWVEQQENVPTAVLGCFSAAVYEQDWPAAPDGVMVTLPFEVEAGLVSDEPRRALEDER